MRVIILGGSGFIGRALTQALISRGDEVVVPTRHVPAATPSTGPEYQLWDGQDHSSLSQLLNGADAVINLLGENIAAKRWSSVQKERIISSRLLAGQALVIALQMPIVKPKVLIQASAIGYYGFWPENASVLESLTPAQMIVKIVNEELTALMGSENQKIKIASQPPTVVMLVGLQGAGKTTNGAKLAGLFKKQNKNPLLAACDIYRPAAIKQLQVVGGQLGIPVFEMGQTNPVDIAKAAIAHAVRHGNDMVFLDTAGRLHVDRDTHGRTQGRQGRGQPG